MTEDVTRQVSAHSIVTVEDLSESAWGAVDEATRKVMVEGVNARALRVAPCLEEPSDQQLAEARLILIGALTRWVNAGSGAFTQQSSGPFSVATDTRTRTGYNLWPSEITDLQHLCAGDGDGIGAGDAFTLDTAPTGRGRHWPWCSAAFSSTWGCSCGADIATKPIFETNSTGPDGAP